MSGGPCAGPGDALEESAAWCSRAHRRWLAALALCAAGRTRRAAHRAISPGQRVDLRVLLVSADGTRAGLRRVEGRARSRGRAVRHVRRLQRADAGRDADRRHGSPTTRADHARYQAVILASRRPRAQRHQPGRHDELSSPRSPTPSGRRWPSSSGRSGSGSSATTPRRARRTGSTPSAARRRTAWSATLTATGKLAFPYLKGPVAIADDDPAAAETFGYPATPVNGNDWQTLLAGPDGTAFLGIYTHPDDGREEMVMTVASNQFQNHNQLLRHGMLNWVTRGVFLGYQRNYLELQVDDLFLGDDAWDPATQHHQLRPGAASRMTPADVDRAIAWSRRAACGSTWPSTAAAATLYASRPAPRRPARGQVRRSGRARRVRLHQPHLRAPEPGLLDDAVHHRQISDNLAWAREPRDAAGDAAEVVTGEHSGPRQLPPRQPRHDRSAVASTTSSPPRPAARSRPGPTTTRSPRARRPARRSPRSRPASSSARRPTRTRRPSSFNAVCHAVGYDLYRSPAGAGAWTRVGDARARRDRADRRRRDPIELTRHRHRRDRHGRRRRRRPTRAALAPYAQNPNFLAGITAAGIRTSPATRRRPTRRPDRTSPARRGRRARRSSRAASRPCRATRATSTTTSRARASSSTSTTGSTSRPPTAAAACRSRASRRAARRPRPGPSTWPARTA